mmetsp:Transcript_64461/g.119921  ORF Transcript_64461/g.119921 Transcript_64461/m.119921 type:complete len:476 (+) Transcript_64461:74-1501(+)
MEGADRAAARRARLANMQKREAEKDEIGAKYRASSGKGVGQRVTEASLARLDRREGGTTGHDDEGLTVKSFSSHTAASSSSRPGVRSARQAAGEAVLTPRRTAGSAGSMSARSARLSASEKASGLSGIHDWGLLDRLAAEEQTKERTMEKQHLLEVRSRVRADLDRQMADLEIIKAREREEHERYKDAERAAVEQWQEQERAKEAMRREKRLAEQKVHQAQIAANQARREEARQMEKLQALELSHTIQQSLAHEREKAERQFGLRQVQVTDALLESSASAKVRAQEAERLAKAEEKSLESYALLRQEREQRAKDTKEKSLEGCHLTHAAAVARAEASQSAVRAEQDMRAAQMQQVWQEDLEKDAEEKARAAASRRLHQDSLRQQIALREAKKQTEREEYLNQRAAREVDAREYLTLQRQAAQTKRLREAEHVAEVQRQINLRATKQPQRPGAMSAAEVQLNRKLLDHARSAIAAR